MFQIFFQEYITAQLITMEHLVGSIQYKGVYKTISIRKLLGTGYIIYGAAYGESNTAKCFVDEMKHEKRPWEGKITKPKEAN